MVGTGKRYAEVAEPIPGPTTKRLGEFAQKHKTMWLPAYMSAKVKWCTTRQSAGPPWQACRKYRKVYLPREEMEQLTPGNDYPVFQTDLEGSAYDVL